METASGPLEKHRDATTIRGAELWHIGTPRLGTRLSWWVVWIRSEHSGIFMSWRVQRNLAFR